MGISLKSLFLNPLKTSMEGDTERGGLLEARGEKWLRYMEALAHFIVASTSPFGGGKNQGPCDKGRWPLRKMPPLSKGHGLVTVTELISFLPHPQQLTPKEHLPGVSLV